MWTITRTPGTLQQILNMAAMNVLAQGAAPTLTRCARNQFQVITSVMTQNMRRALNKYKGVPELLPV